MDEHKIEIGFRFKNEFGERFEATSEFTIYDDVSYSEIDEVGIKFNDFLRQVGYVRQNDLIFMEDITEDEYDALSCFLDEYREKQKHGREDNT